MSEIAEHALERRGAVAAHVVAGGHALPEILGVEDDHAALFHVGVDLGEHGFRQRARVRQHRPVENGEEGDLVGVDVDGKRLAGLHRRPRRQVFAEPDQALAARLVGARVTGEHIAESDFGRGLDGGDVGGPAARRNRRLRTGGG